MNRRHFLQLTAATPLGIGPAAIREERAALVIDGTILTHMIVRAHGSEKAAELYRRGWIGRPFEGFGEFYRDSTEILDLPRELASLPGTLTFHTATVGAAAERRTYLVGAFRRENMAIIVRIMGDYRGVMHSIADHVSSQKVPSSFEVIWNAVHLQKFIPGADDLGMSIEDSDSYWP